MNIASKPDRPIFVFLKRINWYSNSSYVIQKTVYHLSTSRIFKAILSIPPTSFNKYSNSIEAAKCLINQPNRILIFYCYGILSTVHYTEQ